MFSDYYLSFDSEVRKALENLKTPSRERTTDLLQKSKSANLTIPEIAELLDVGRIQEPKEQFDLIRQFSYDIFRKKSNELRHISPVYLSSHCVDSCGYCQFSAKKKDTTRTRLTLSELEKELKEGVFPLGSKVIEFTLATDPEFTSSKLAQYISMTQSLLSHTAGSGTLLCSDYFSEEGYRELKSAGLRGMVQWDETLDSNSYNRWHKGSVRKGNFKERMDNHDRAISQGLEVATGILFGLADFRYDVLMQISKARYLALEHGKKPFVFGTPRIKSIGGLSMHPQNEVGDLAYETSLRVYKIAEPSIGRWLQTRESSKLNFRNMLNQDFYTYKCGEVKPGGYKVHTGNLNGIKGSQFKVLELDKSQFEEEIASKGFKLNYAWIKDGK